MFIKCNSCGFAGIHVPPTTNITCPKCEQTVTITHKNIVAFRTGELKELGIVWTWTCQRCGRIVDPFHLWKEESKTLKRSCPLCRDHGFLLGEYMPGLPEDSLARDFVGYMKGFMDFCDHIVKSTDSAPEKVKRLAELVIVSCIDESGQISEEKTRDHWKEVATSLEDTWQDLERRGYITPEMNARQKPIWQDMKQTMTTGKVMKSPHVDSGTTYTAHQPAKAASTAKTVRTEFLERNREYIDGLNSPFLKDRAQVFGMLDLTAWSKQESVEKADAIKLLVATLNHPDPILGLKVASCLADVSGIADIYVLKALNLFLAGNPLVHTQWMYFRNQYRRKLKTKDMNMSDLSQEAKEVLDDAMIEVSCHGFSSPHRGQVQMETSTEVSYVLEVDLSRQDNERVLLSLGNKTAQEQPVADYDTDTILKAFCQDGSPTELRWSKPTKLRYFTWGIDVAKPQNMPTLVQVLWDPLRYQGMLRGLYLRTGGIVSKQHFLKPTPRIMEFIPARLPALGETVAAGQKAGESD